MPTGHYEVLRFLRKSWEAFISLKRSLSAPTCKCEDSLISLRFIAPTGLLAKGPLLSQEGPDSASDYSVFHRTPQIPATQAAVIKGSSCPKSEHASEEAESSAQ